MENVIPIRPNWKRLSHEQGPFFPARSKQQRKDRRDAFDYHALKLHKYFGPDVLKDFYLSVSTLPCSQVPKNVPLKIIIKISKVMVTRLQKLAFQVLIMCHVPLGYVCAQLPGGTDKPFELTVIPPSPDVSALAKYADIPVGLYSGTPTISIPLYEIKERELSLPVAMNYHGSRNKETIALRTRT